MSDRPFDSGKAIGERIAEANRLIKTMLPYVTSVQIEFWPGSHIIKGMWFCRSWAPTYWVSFESVLP